MKSKLFREKQPTITHSQISRKDDNKIGKNTLFRLTEEQFNNNIRIIKEINEKIINCKNLSLSELNQCLIDVYDLLMSIPYKYGRVNLEKCSMGITQINKYITHIGFPYLVKKLRENKEMKVPDTVLNEIISIFPCAFNRFLFFQYQEQYLDQSDELIVLPQKLFQDIHNQQDEIEKIQALQYTLEDKEKFLSSITEISRSISLIENEINQLQQMMKSPETIQQEIVATKTTIELLEKEINHYCTKKKELEFKLKELKQQEISPERKKENLRQDEIKKTERQIEAIPSEINKIQKKLNVQEIEVIKFEKILEERNLGKDFLEEQYKNNSNKVNEINTQISVLRERKLTLEKTDVAKDKIVEHQRDIKKVNSEIEALETEFTSLKKKNMALELSIRYANLTQEQKNKTLTELKTKYDSLLDTQKKKNELRQIATQKDSIGVRKNLDVEQGKRIKLNEQLSQLNVEENQLQLQIDKLQTLIAGANNITLEKTKNVLQDLQSAKIEGNKFTKRYPLPLNKDELDKHRDERIQIDKKIDDAKHHARFFISNEDWKILETKLFNIQNKKDKMHRERDTINQNIKKLEKEIQEIEKVEKQREELIRSLPQLKEELEFKKRQFSEIPTKENKDTYQFIELVRIQKEYDLDNITHILRSFEVTLSAAETNSTIILAIIDFVNWHKEYCGKEMAQKIENIISSKLIKDFRGFRNRAMHGVDFIDNLNTMTNTATLQTLEDLKKLVLSLFVCLQDPRNEDYLCGRKEKLVRFSSTSPVVEKIENCLPELKIFLDENGNKRKLDRGEQLDFITNSVLNSKAIIKFINESLRVNSLKEIIHIMSEPNNELTPSQLNVKLKYDSLLQSLGQSIGNLQQYTEVDLTEAISISLNDIENDFYILNKLVPQIKDYRSSRVHSGYYNQVFFTAVLTNIASNFEEINSQLDAYLKKVEKFLVTGSILERDNSSKMVICQTQ